MTVKSEGLACRVCDGAIAVRALDRERGWVECSFCENVRRIGAPLPVEFEQSPENRMLWVHKGERDDIVIRPLGGPVWLYPAVIWLELVAVGTVVVGGGGWMIAVTFCSVIATALYLLWRRVEAQITVDPAQISFSRYFRGRRLWSWSVDRADDPRLELSGLGATHGLVVEGESGRRIRVGLRSADERHWLHRALERALAPNDVLGTTTCTNCDADLVVTARIRRKEAINCDYCGIGLVFDGAHARAVTIVLETDIDTADVADLYPDDAGVERGRTGKDGVRWIVSHPSASLVSGVAFVLLLGLVTYLGVRAVGAALFDDSPRQAVHFYLHAWPAELALVLGSLGWWLAAPDYGTLEIAVTDRRLTLDKSMWGRDIYHYELPLISLWNVGTRTDGRARLVVLTVRTCFRSVSATWKLDEIDAAKVVRELYAELDRRLRFLERRCIVRPAPRPAAYSANGAPM